MAVCWHSWQYAPEIMTRKYADSEAEEGGLEDLAVNLYASSTVRWYSTSIEGWFHFASLLKKVERC